MTCNTEETARSGSHFAIGGLIGGFPLAVDVEQRIGPSRFTQVTLTKALPGEVKAITVDVDRQAF
jgi:hypothetical protein